MPSMQELYNLFRINPNAFPGTNPGVFNGAAAEEAAAIPPNFEQLRQSRNTLAHDTAETARYEAPLNETVGENVAGQEAKSLGFPDPRAQQEHSAMQKLQQVLLPEQAKAQTAAIAGNTQREFLASEHDQDRQSRADLVTAAQTGQTGRNQAALSAREQQFQQLHPPSMMDKIKGFFGGGGSTAPAAPTSGTVHMVTPDGRDMPAVPASEVQRLVGLGAHVVQ